VELVLGGLGGVMGVFFLKSLFFWVKIVVGVAETGGKGVGGGGGW